VTAAEKLGKAAQASASERKNFPDMNAMKPYLREVLLDGDRVVDIRPFENRTSPLTVDEAVRRNSVSPAKNKGYGASVTVKEHYSDDADNFNFNDGFDFDVSQFQNPSSLIEDPAAATSAGWPTATGADVLRHVNGGQSLAELNQMTAFVF